MRIGTLIFENYSGALAAFSFLRKLFQPISNAKIHHPNKQNRNQVKQAKNPAHEIPLTCGANWPQHGNKQSDCQKDGNGYE